MPEPGYVSVGIESSQSGGQEPEARVAELEASVRRRLEEVELLGRRADRQNNLHLALLDLTALQDESTLHRRIQDLSLIHISEPTRLQV